MKNILKIFKRDLKNIFTNWVALVIVAATIILPALYAWFNIKASWDPYSNTAGIKVAVVNEDLGGVFNENSFNVGETLIETLEDNDSFGWQFVSKEEADEGIVEGRYYASIEIPEDFTESVLSLTTSSVKRPSLIYNINEKSNAIVPKITNTGINTIKESLNKSILKVVSGVIFDVFDGIGETAGDYKDKLRNIVDGLYELNDKMPEIESMLNETSEGLEKLDDLIEKVEEIMPIASSTVQQSQDLIQNGQAKVDDVIAAADLKSSEIKNKIVEAQQTITSIQNVLKEHGSKTAKEKLTVIKGELELVDNKLNAAIDVLNVMKTKLDAIKFDTSKISETITQLQKLQNQITLITNEINNTIKNIDEGNVDELAIGQLLVQIENKINTVQSGVNEIIASYENKVVPVIREGYKSLNSISSNGLYMLDVVEDTIPDINYLISIAQKGSSLGQEELDKVKEKFPKVKEKLNSVVDKIKEYDDGESFDKVVDLLINNSSESSTFLSDIVNVERNAVFTVPNYGSALSPFYTTLALWVGGTILVSLFTTHAKKLEDAEEIKPYEEYFGKGLTFVSIAAIQGIVITLGDIVLLKTYAVHPVKFVLIGMLTSIIFVTFIYTLVSVFGNVGKALAIIALVLQVAGSGGTFPVEVMSDFFQKLNPLLPFTYAIGLMRETTAGIVDSIFVRNLIYLSIYFVIAIIMGIALKKFVNKHTKKFTEKLEESGLAGH